MAETKRHNEAIEELTEPREKFLEQETARKDHLAKLKRELAEANQDEIATNRPLDVLSQFKKANPPLHELLLREFYTPSNEAKKYQMFGVVIFALLVGGGIFLDISTFSNNK